VAYIVLSSRDGASYRKDAPALQELLKTLPIWSRKPRANRNNPDARARFYLNSFLVSPDHLRRPYQWSNSDWRTV